MIFVIRPEPGLQSTMQLAREMGLPAVSMPLFEVFPVQWDAPPSSAFDALLIGSSNAVRYGGHQLEAYRDLPVYAVGQMTANAAIQAGFSVAQTGEGGLQAVLDGVEGPLRFLRLAGTERVTLELPEGSSMEEREVYHVRALPITSSAQIGLRASSAVILLHSAAAARHFAEESERLGLDKRAIRLACIGPRVAEAAGSGWGDVRSAPHPNDRDLLELTREMCQ